jgi:hypothetical protein
MTILRHWSATLRQGIAKLKFLRYHVGNDRAFTDIDPSL